VRCALNPVSEETGVVGSMAVCGRSSVSTTMAASCSSSSSSLFFKVKLHFVNSLTIGKITCFCLSPLVAHGVFRIDGRVVERKLLELQRFFVTLKFDRVVFVSLVNYGAAAAAAALSLRNS
jgi:hypothetical protein